MSTQPVLQDGDGDGDGVGNGNDIFNKEALEQQAGYRARGAMLLRPSLWGRGAVGILCGFLASFLLFVWLVRVPRYLDCPGEVVPGAMLLSCSESYQPWLGPGLPASVTIRGYGALPGRFAVATVGGGDPERRKDGVVPVWVPLPAGSTADGFLPAQGMKGAGLLTGPAQPLLFAILGRMDRR
jgi:hypothetical protein